MSGTPAAAILGLSGQEPNAQWASVLELRYETWFDAIMAEIEGFFAACRKERVWPGGIHLEFTGEDVTECLGGSEAVLEAQLNIRYMTLCDPRLNARQSLDLAFRLAELMRRNDSRPASA